MNNDDYGIEKKVYNRPQILTIPEWVAANHPSDDLVLKIAAYILSETNCRLEMIHKRAQDSFVYMESIERSGKEYPKAWSHDHIC